MTPVDAWALEDGPTDFGGDGHHEPRGDAHDVQDAPLRTSKSVRQANRQGSQATLIVRLVQEAGCDFWHTAAGDAYISIETAGHAEHYPFNSRATKDYLSRLYFNAEKKAPNASALSDAINTLSGFARFDGQVHPVAVRVAGHIDRICIDLCDDEWRAIEVRSDGWEIVTRPPVRFRRAKGMLPLPVPERGGSIRELRPYLNVANDDDFTMMTAWLTQALRRDPIL